MNKLTLTLPATLVGLLILGASPLAEAGGGRGGFRSGAGAPRGSVVKGQALSVPGGVKNLVGPVKGQALTVPGGVANLGPANLPFGDGLGLGFVGGGGWGFGYGAGFAPWLYQSGHIPVPPYFALHPPVYYSHPVPRTYGYSPFAYPNYVRTPEVIETTPSAIIKNPYFDKQDTLDEGDVDDIEDDVVSGVPPQTVLNPYFDGNRAADALQVVKTTGQTTADEQADSGDATHDQDGAVEDHPAEIINPYVESEA